MQKQKSVEDYLAKHPQWHSILLPLRQIMLSCGLEETVKWGAPTYCREGKNIAGLASFKSYAGIWFFQGALLQDSQKKLLNAQEGTTHAMRQWRFYTEEEFDEALIKSYVLEAMEHQQTGKKLRPPARRTLSMPPLLLEALQKQPDLAEKFDSMAPACKREYADYINEAKREETRLRRLEKVIPMILDGGGLNDKYKK